MNVHGFHHLAIQVHDLERVAAFYRDVLGLAEMARHAREDGSLRSIWVAVPGGGFLALEHTKMAPPDESWTRETPGPLVVAFRIHRADRPRLLAELAARGVPVVHQSRWTVYVRDPEGNRIGLSHHPQDPL